MPHAMMTHKYYANTDFGPDDARREHVSFAVAHNRVDAIQP